MFTQITDSVLYIGVDDKTIDLFESQYAVPNGVSYNSYLIKDEKYCVMDTADARKSDEWLSNLTEALDGHAPDYLVISHMEPDHSGSIKLLCDRYPHMKLVGNDKTFTYLGQFFDWDFSGQKVIVKEGDKLPLGAHELTFIMAPMVHWPEVMVSYDSKDKILFSADAFGKFGALDCAEDWVPEARRYYINIVGKYGMMVQSLLKKAAKLNISLICPLHGPILSEDIEKYLNYYDIWSSYRPEEQGVLVAYASAHGHTAEAAQKMAALLTAAGAPQVKLCDLARTDMAEAVGEAFRYSHLMLAAISYNTGVFPCMEHFLLHLKAKNYQNRTVGILENGSWAPSAARCMKEVLSGMKDIRLCEPVVSIRSAMKSSDLPAMVQLASELASR